MKAARFCTRILAAGLALMAGATTVYAQGAPVQQDNAVVLVAKPALVDPVYRRSVLIVSPMQNGGHIGVIVNRPTKQPLSALFPGHAPSKLVQDPVYFGGPMMTEIVIALVKSENSPGEGTLRMTRNLFLAIKEATIDQVIERTPNNAHYFVGTVVWRPGELQEELKRGLWSVMDPDSTLVFDRNPERLWESLQLKANEVSAGLELQHDEFQAYPQHASLILAQ